MQQPFQSMDEVKEYLGGDTIECLICHRHFRKLNHHHLHKIHHLTGDEYRQLFGIPWKRSLSCAPSREAQAARNKRLGLAPPWKKRVLPSQPARPNVPAVRAQWRKNQAIGSELSVEMVPLECPDCGTAFETTRLCASHGPTRCPKCRRAYYDRFKNKKLAA